MKTRTISVLFTILLLCIGVSNVYCAVNKSNKISISGVVKDQSGEPIIGASVVLKVGASSSGSVTDVLGRFNASIDAQEQTLFQITVSYIGFKSAGGVYSVSSLKNGKGTVTVKLLDDVKKNKSKSSTIVAHDFSSSSSTDSFTFDFKYPSTSINKTPEQLYNEANNFYKGTNGISKDYKKAVELYLQAANRGHVGAQFQLGYYYAMESVPLDYKQAMQWYLKAAEQGNRSAMFNIGIMYERGQGVNVDKSQALAWYNQSAEAGLDLAKENAKKLVAQGVKPATLMSNSQIRVASFKLLENDVTAITRGTEKLSYNGERAALVRIVTPERGFAFEGGTLGIVSTEERIGEIWLYVPSRAQKLTILHPSLGILRDYYYPIDIKSGRTYEMVLQTKNQQNDKPKSIQYGKRLGIW